MDATTNDIPAGVDLEIQGFPTLVLWKAEDNKMIKHEGGRDLESLQNFLVANAKNGHLLPINPVEVEDETDDESENEDDITEKDEL